MEAEDEISITKVEGLQNPVQGLQNPVQGLQNPVQELQNPVQGLQNPVQGLQNLVQGLQNPVQGLQNPVQGLQNPVQGLQNPVQGLQKPVQGLQKPVQGSQKSVQGLPKTKPTRTGRPPKRRRTVTLSTADNRIKRGRPKKGVEKVGPPIVRVSGERKSNRVPVAKQEEKFFTEKWTHENKKKLLEALRSIPPTDYEALSNYIVDKSPFQIEYYLQRLKKQISWKGTHKLHVPLENWIHLASELVKPESKDYTDCFSRVMSVISNFEEFPTPCKTVPDYTAIYRYLDCVLQGKALPELGKLESAVVLDLLHGLVEVLRTHDTSQQRHIMKLKYEMLNSRATTGHMMEYINKARRALTNDFTLSEYQGKDNQSNSARIDTRNCNKSPVKSRPSNEPQPGCSSQSDDQGHCTGQSNQVLNLNERIRRSSVKQEHEHYSEVEDTEVEDENIKEKTTKTKKSEEDPNIPHKPSLFTLNPFCIPVSLLKLKRNPKKNLMPSQEIAKIEAIVPNKRPNPLFRCPQPKTTKIHLCLLPEHKRQKLFHQLSSSPGSASKNKDVSVSDVCVVSSVEEH